MARGSPPVDTQTMIVLPGSAVWDEPGDCRMAVRLSYFVPRADFCFSFRPLLSARVFASWGDMSEKDGAVIPLRRP